MVQLPDSAIFVDDSNDTFEGGGGASFLHNEETKLGSQSSRWDEGPSNYIEIHANNNLAFTSNNIWVDSIRTFWAQEDGSNNVVYPYAIAVKSMTPGSTWSNVAGSFTGASLALDAPVVSEWANSRPKAFSGLTTGFFPNTYQQTNQSGHYPDGIMHPTVDPVGQFVNRVRIYAKRAYHQAPWDYEAKDDEETPLWFEVAHSSVGPDDNMYLPKLLEIEMWQGSSPVDTYVQTTITRPEIFNENLGDVEVTTETVVDALRPGGSLAADLIDDEEISDTMIAELSGSKITAQSIKADAIGAGAIVTGHLEVLGGVNNLIPDPSFVHGYLQNPQYGIHRVTGHYGSSAKKYGIEEQIRALTSYAETTNSISTYNSKANTQHDWQSPRNGSGAGDDWGPNHWPVSGTIYPRDWWCVANLHYTVSNTAPAVYEESKLNEFSYDLIGHPDAYNKNSGVALTPSANSSKFFLSYWIPGDYSFSPVANYPDGKGYPENPAIAFGVLGMSSNTTLLALYHQHTGDYNWIYRNSHHNVFGGRTSNVTSQLWVPYNTQQKRIVCSANDTFVFSAMMRIVDAEEHGLDYNTTPGGAVSWDGGTSAATTHALDPLVAGNSNNVVRAAAWFYSASGDLAGKTVGPWTEPFDEATKGGGRGTWSNTDTGGSGATRQGWAEVNFIGTGKSYTYAPSFGGLSGLPVLQTTKEITRERPIFGPAEIAETTSVYEQEVSYFTVGVEFSHATRKRHGGGTSKGAHYLIANPTCTRAIGKLDVDEISAGSITVGNFKERYGVGSSGKIIIDGENSRIVITD
jgi:hypothetical protein